MLKVRFLSLFSKRRDDVPQAWEWGSAFSASEEDAPASRYEQAWVSDDTDRRTRVQRTRPRRSSNAGDHRRQLPTVESLGDSVRTRLLMDMMDMAPRPCSGHAASKRIGSHGR